MKCNKSLKALSGEVFPQTAWLRELRLAIVPDKREAASVPRAVCVLLSWVGKRPWTCGLWRCSTGVSGRSCPPLLLSLLRNG